MIKNWLRRWFRLDRHWHWADDDHGFVLVEYREPCERCSQ